MVKPAQRLKVSILRRPALVFIIFFILNILWAGFSAKPYGISDLADLAKSPFVSHAKYDYILESPLFFIAAHPFTALKSGYMLFCLLVLASAYFAFFYKLKQYREYKLRILLGLLFLAHPVSYILLNWIGMEDSLTVLSTVFILFSASPVVICIVSAIAMFNHAQALFIVPSLLMLRHMAHAEEIKNKHITAGLIGIVLGKILSMVFLSVTTVTAQPRWNLVFSESLGYWLKINASYFPLELYSFNFSLWLIIVLSIFYFRKNNTSYYLGYVCMMALFFVITFFTKDATRVFALLSWAPTLHLIAYSYKESQKENTVRNKYFRTVVVATAFFGWLLPRFYIWEGQIYSPGVTNLLRTAAKLVSF